MVGADVVDGIFKHMTMTWILASLIHYLFSLLKNRNKSGQNEAATLFSLKHTLYLSAADNELPAMTKSRGDVEDAEELLTCAKKNEREILRSSPSMSQGAAYGFSIGSTCTNRDGAATTPEE